MRTIPMLLAAIALVVGGCQTSPQALSEQDAAAIREHIAAYVEAQQANDWAALAALHTEDGLRMAPNMPAAQGREKIQQALEVWPGTVTACAARAVEIDGVNGLAYARGPYSVTYSLEGQEEPVTDDGKFLAVFRQQEDGSWLTARIMWNSDLPLVAPGEEEEAETEK